MIKSILISSIIVMVLTGLYALSGWLTGRNDQPPGCSGGSCSGCRFEDDPDSDCHRKESEQV